MPNALQLSALLSQIWVAFIIECDNEFEHLMLHRSTDYGGSRQSPWLVSTVMCWNCMRFVEEGGIRVAELAERAITKTNLHGMVRWGYITIAPDPSDRRPKMPKSAWLIRATAKGRHAQEIWRPLPGLIEARWEQRFGKEAVGGLRESLRAVVSSIPFELPDVLPIVAYGLFNKGRVRIRREPAKDTDIAALVLPALLARTLLAFALQFERESDLSLAICANILRVLDDKGVRVPRLPVLSGVSKESISMGLGFLEKKGVIEVSPDPTQSRWKLVRLTAKGRQAQEASCQSLSKVEASWEARFGADTIHTLRQALEALAGNLPTGKSPLLNGIVTYPDGWRAKVRQAEILPHFPMVLHRGGYPDGS